MKIKLQKLLTLSLTVGLTFGISSLVAFAEPLSEIETTKSQITEVGDKIRASEEKISVLTEEIILKTEEINKGKEEIKKLDDEITITEKNITETKAKLSRQEDIYGERLRQNYKSGQLTALRTILSSRSFSDFLIKVKVIKSINTEDHKLVTEITETRDLLIAKENGLNKDRETKIALVDKLNKDNEELNKNKESQMAELGNLEAEKEQLFTLLQGQEVALFDNIKAILNDPASTEEEIKSTLAVINSIKNQVSTQVALDTGEKLLGDADSKLTAMENARIEEEKAAALRARAAEATKIETSYTQSASANVKSSGTMTFYLSFYTDLPEENGGYTTTATGAPLTYGVVASNYWPMYTKIYLEGYGTMTVLDRGGSDFNSSSRLDILIPRKSGESNYQYKRRVLTLGRTSTTGYIVK